ATHAARAAELLGMVGSTRENIEKMVRGEDSADTGKMEAARIAREEGNKDAARFFEEAARDEARYRAGLEGILKWFDAHG
ncbi:MAG: ferritin family protein, partial [Candidatus Syntropharchaeales archaeon]